MGKRKNEKNDVDLVSLKKKFKKAQEDLEKFMAERQTVDRKEDETIQTDDDKSTKDEEFSDNESVSHSESTESEDLYSEPEFETVGEEVDQENEIPRTNAEEKVIDITTDGKQKPLEGEEKPLDNDLMEVLEIDPTESKTVKINLHSSVHKRWKYWNDKGMKKEERAELMEKYGNLKDLGTPKINPELEMNLPRPTKTKDNYMQLRQNLASTALSSLGLAAESLIENKLDRKLLFNLIVDAGSIIADLMHCQTKSRRSFILSMIPRDKREVMQGTKSDEFLFGEKLIEKFKDSKNWENLFLNKYVNKRQGVLPQRQTLNTISLQGTRSGPYHAGTSQGHFYQNKKRPSKFITQRKSYNQKPETVSHPRKSKNQYKYK